MSIVFYQLEKLDPEPTLLESPQDLNDAFTATALFSAKLVSLSVTMIVDGVDQGEIADETSSALIIEGVSTELSLAELAGFADQLGDENRISALAGFDLDGNETTVEIELFASKLFSKADNAQTIVGSGASELLLGGDDDDVIAGGGGNDILLGYGGNDTLEGGGGADVIKAGEGDDLIRVAEMTEPGDVIDGGLGRDVLAIDAVGEINSLLGALEFSGIEALDMTNGQIDNLALTLDEVIDFSDEDDTVLQDLLGAAFDNTRSFLGDVGDTFTIDGQGIYSFEKNGIETDADGNSFEIYAFSIGGGNPLATLGVDTDIEVTTANMVT